MKQKNPMILFHVSGIKCDAAECDYKNDEVNVDDYAQWLNKPCPLCGANLLTDADYSAVKAMIATADWAAAILPAVPDNTYRVKIPIELDGSGVPKVGAIKT